MKSPNQIARNITNRYNDEEFAPGGGELDMVHEAVTVAVQEAQSGSIYMIAYVGRDDDNYPTSSLDEDFGFFLTEEAAEAWVETHEDFEARYQAQIEHTKQTNIQRHHEAAVKRRVWDEMKAEGVNPGFFRPGDVKDLTVLPFERWKADMSRYAVVEVKPAVTG